MRLPHEDRSHFSQRNGLGIFLHILRQNLHLFERLETARHHLETHRVDDRHDVILAQRLDQRLALRLLGFALPLVVRVGLGRVVAGYSWLLPRIPEVEVRVVVPTLSLFLRRPNTSRVTVQVLPYPQRVQQIFEFLGQLCFLPSARPRVVLLRLRLLRTCLPARLSSGTARAALRSSAQASSPALRFLG